MNAVETNIVCCSGRVQNPIRKWGAVCHEVVERLMADANRLEREILDLVRMHEVLPALRSDVIR